MRTTEKQRTIIHQHLIIIFTYLCFVALSSSYFNVSRERQETHDSSFRLFVLLKQIIKWHRATNLLIKFILAKMLLILIITDVALL